MSIQWRWTRRAINIPWQDRSRGKWREDGEGERKENWTSKREKGREEVSEKTGSMDWFIRQAVAFFPIIRKHFSGPPQDNEAIAALGDLQPIRGRYKMLAAFIPHSYTQTQPPLAHLWLFSVDGSSLYTNHDLKKRVYPMWVLLWVCSVGYFSLSVECVVFQYDTVNKQEKALYPPPASLVPRHLCQSHFGLLMRHQPSVPPPRLLRQLSLLTGKSMTKVLRQNTCSRTWILTLWTWYKHPLL